MTQYAPTPAEIETLREDLSNLIALARPFMRDDAQTLGLSKAQESLAILDRLSPPAPEVDEATKIWREMNAEGARACGSIPLMIHKWLSGEHDNSVHAIAEIAYLRTVLSELISSKDAEIDEEAALRVGAIERMKAAETELAALRAEIERLKDNFLALAKSAAELIYATDGMEALREQRASVLNALKAAERNTAEPAIDGQTSVFPPIDTAPVVEVTQARECMKEIFGFTDERLDAYEDDKRLIEIISRYITKAEARGRREALEKDWDAISEAVITAWQEADFRMRFATASAELKRMMTEVK